LAHFLAEAQHNAQLIRLSHCSRTSARRKQAVPPAISIRRTVPCPPFSSISETTTIAPSRARHSAIARPQPIPPAPAMPPTPSLMSISRLGWRKAYHGVAVVEAYRHGQPPAGVG